MNDGRKRFGWLRRRADDFASAVEPGELMRAGELVSLHRHVPGNRPAFQRWYADDEIARLLRHDQRPLNEIQSRGYFDTIIMPGSAIGVCFAIHENATGRLIGTCALTDFSFENDLHSAFFRIVIGEKDCWGKGYGTEATQLICAEGFENQNLDVIKLEVFEHNPRAIHAYDRVGFKVTGEHVEYVGRHRWQLHVVEMALTRQRFAERYALAPRPEDEEYDDVYDDDEEVDYDEYLFIEVDEDDFEDDEIDEEIPDDAEPTEEPVPAPDSRIEPDDDLLDEEEEEDEMVDDPLPEEPEPERYAEDEDEDEENGGDGEPGPAPTFVR